MSKILFLLCFLFWYKTLPYISFVTG